MFGLVTVLLAVSYAGHVVAHPLAAPQPGEIAPGSHVSGGEEYVVIVDRDQVHSSAVLSRLDLSPDHQDVRYTFENAGFHGFVASMKPHCLGALDSMTDILHVEKRVTASSRDTVRAASPWGLQRISSTSDMSGNSQTLDYDYTYNDTRLGSGADIYVLDTGIYTSNKVFGGRARMGWSFEPDSTDHDGHGTHVSSTAAGDVFGVASGANLIGVKVLGDDGSGDSSNTIAGIDYVIQMHETRKLEDGFVGSIMSMSWGLDAQSPAIQTAIMSAIGQGIHVSIAAGNAGGDACSTSPSMGGGSNSAAIVVGSIDETSSISSFSNTGPCVDLYAPGENILSAWIGAPNVVQYLSGTSMACPHVTGVMAYLMASDPALAASPAALKSQLLSMALTDMVHGKAVVGDSFRLVSNGATSQQQDTQLASRSLSEGNNALYKVFASKRLNIVRDEEWSTAGTETIETRY